MRALPLSCLLLLGIAGLWSMLAATQDSNSALAELPREYVDTTYVEPDGQVYQVASGDNLQRALNSAQPGDVIELEAGATFVGPFTLPRKPPVTSGSPWIVIRSSEMERLPAEGVRVVPADNAFMPKLVASTGAVIATESGAHHYRFIGVEIHPAAENDRSLMNIVRSTAGILRGEARLYEEALEKRIVFVSPTLLIPSLQLIKNVWKQEYQNRNSQEIARHAISLYEKFVGFTNDLIDLGNQLKKTQGSYENAMSKLATGNGNLVRSVERFKALGIKPSKNVDQRLADRSGEQADLFE